MIFRTAQGTVVGLKEMDNTRQYAMDVNLRVNKRKLRTVTFLTQAAYMFGLEQGCEAPRYVKGSIQETNWR
jgi:hypothetical protein